MQNCAAHLTVNHENKTILHLLAPLHISVMEGEEVVFPLQLLPGEAGQSLLFTASLPPVHDELGGDLHVGPGQLHAAAILVLAGSEGDNVEVNLGVEGGGGRPKVAAVLF